MNSMLILLFSVLNGYQALAQPKPVDAAELAKSQTNVTASDVVEGQPPVPASTPNPVAVSVISSDVSFTLENSLNLRDPFRRIRSKSGDGLADGATIPELERYELDKFKLVGVITGPKKNKALIISSGDNQMHIVTEGIKLGTRGGHIKKIAPGMIAIEEKVVNLLGQEESVETTIEFDKSKEQALSQQNAIPGFPGGFPAGFPGGLPKNFPANFPNGVGNPGGMPGTNGSTNDNIYNISRPPGT